MMATRHRGQEEALIRDFLAVRLERFADHVSYFGLMQEVVYERLYWEVFSAEGGETGLS
jgi:hypothetical protein